jgi:hypothetical protein
VQCVVLSTTGFKSIETPEDEGNGILNTHTQTNKQTQRKRTKNENTRTGERTPAIHWIRG